MSITLVDNTNDSLEDFFLQFYRKEEIYCFVKVNLKYSVAT